MQCQLEPLRQHCIRFDLCNVIPNILRQHCTGFKVLGPRLHKPLILNEIFLSMQNCLEPLWQHYIVFSAVQCWPKSIRATLHRTIYVCVCLCVLYYLPQREKKVCSRKSNIIEQFLTKYLSISLFWQHCMG